MKKLSLLLTALFVLCAGSALGQTDQSFDVAANIQTAITINVVTGTLQFGTVQDDSNPYLSPDGDATPSSNVGTSATVAEFTVTGSAVAQISWTTNTVLGDGTETIPFTPSITRQSGGGGFSTVSQNDTFTLTGTASDNEFEIGGELGIDIYSGVGSPSGAFSTTSSNGIPLTITLSYTAI